MTFVKIFILLICRLLVYIFLYNIDDLEKGRHKSSVLVMESCLSFNKLSVWWKYFLENDATLHWAIIRISHGIQCPTQMVKQRLVWLRHNHTNLGYWHGRSFHQISYMKYHGRQTDNDTMMLDLKCAQNKNCIFFNLSFWNSVKDSIYTMCEKWNFKPASNQSDITFYPTKWVRNAQIKVSKWVVNFIQLPFLDIPPGWIVTIFLPILEKFAQHENHESHNTFQSRFYLPLHSTISWRINTAWPQMSTANR